MNGTRFVQELGYVICWNDRRYKELNRAFPFVVAYTDCSTEHEKTVPMIRL